MKDRGRKRKGGEEEERKAFSSLSPFANAVEKKRSGKTGVGVNRRGEEERPRSLLKSRFPILREKGKNN